MLTTSVAPSIWGSFGVVTCVRPLMGFGLTKALTNRFFAWKGIPAKSIIAIPRTQSTGGSVTDHGPESLNAFSHLPWSANNAQRLLFGAGNLNFARRPTEVL